MIELIGNTPLVRMDRIGRDLSCQLLAKLEFLNPGSSIKDRPALAMIDAAEADGLLRRGGTIVEPTSGNTGVGLAIVAARRGYRCIFTMPDKIATEKVALLRAYGAEVVVCPTAVDPSHPDSYYSVARRLTESTPGAFMPNQYANPANPAAHEMSTGRRCGARPPAASPTWWPGSAPEGRSAAWAVTSRPRTPGSRSSEPTRRDRCTPGGRAGPTWSRGSARTSGRPPTTARSRIGW